MPIASGLTPHGLRYSHKTLMDELGVPPKLMDERMGHDDGSVQARYSLVTGEMRRRFLEDLTAVWLAAVEARQRLNPSSSVVVLDRLLRSEGQGPNKIDRIVCCLYHALARSRSPNAGGGSRHG
jgi:hypothetical protein